MQSIRYFNYKNKNDNEIDNQFTAEPNYKAPRESVIEDEIENANNSVNLDDANLYEELKATNEIDPDDISKSSAAKNISLKLLGTTDPREVLRIFEDEIIRMSDRKPHGEELCLILKFLQHSIR